MISDRVRLAVHGKPHIGRHYSVGWDTYEWYWLDQESGRFFVMRDASPEYRNLARPFIQSLQQWLAK